MDVGSLPSEIGAGDVVVVGDRDDAQRARDRARRRPARHQQRDGADATSSLALAGERGVVVVSSPLDSYVTAA